MRKVYLIILMVGLVVFSSCQPKKMIFKPIINLLMVNDSICTKIGNGDLLYNGNFHYFTQLFINNKSYSTVYINKRLDSMVSVYEDINTYYKFNYLSDSIIAPQLEEEIYMAFDSRKDTIVSDFFSNRKKLKKKHKFVMSLHFIVGDSIVKKEIVFKPK